MIGCAEKPNPGSTFSVMSYNVGNRTSPIPTTRQVAEVILKHGVPDILLIQDTPWEIKIKDLAEAVGYSYFITGRKMAVRSNLAIFSRLPLSNPNTIHFHLNNSTPAALCAETRVSGKTVLFCTLHLSTLRFTYDRIVREGGAQIPGVLGILRDEYFRETQHSRSVEKLLKWIESKRYDAIILGGDFNTFLFTKPIRAITSHLDDALWPSADYFAGTYRNFRFPIKPRIDYIFYSQGLDRLKAEIIRETPGDHYPVKAVFGLIEPGN
ncbi:MAG: endonuclease/exonuclease/phosphatase family protein [Deltaproteobacteria bacterium]|nr:endonuclease/exonuclease/phosphatase family protein [Deltaproteobacteria bacterium]MBW2141802.1 endonuclease/exonuclease/phosphatase family protein [Deltaproteobacteria bacterium]MBW2324483.1 endonuclease/exonuclease/phosphatase family protein [Deltaproteobacteria bacterium]